VPTRYSANRALICLQTVQLHSTTRRIVAIVKLRFINNLTYLLTNPNLDIRHFNTERWCSNYCAMENIGLYINVGFLCLVAWVSNA